MWNAGVGSSRYAEGNIYGAQGGLREEVKMSRAASEILEGPTARRRE